MKKILYILATLCIVILLLGVIVFAKADFFLGRVISKSTGTKVSIEKIEFNDDEILLKGISVRNPSNTKNKIALTIETLKIDAPYGNYFKDPININHLLLSRVFIDIQFYNKSQSKGNWNTILTHMEKRHSKSPLSVERKAFIKTLEINNLRIDLTLAGGKTNHLSAIPHLIYHDIDTDHGVPTEEITEIIIEKMMESVFLLKGLKMVLDLPKNTLDTLLKPLDLFKKSK